MDARTPGAVISPVFGVPEREPLHSQVLVLLFQIFLEELTGSTSVMSEASKARGVVLV